MSLNGSNFSEERGLAKSVLGFLSGTLLSRISGFFRDVSMAFFFGVDASIAAFLVALRFAVLLRRIFGEGAFLNGFVPHFEEQRRVGGRQAARFFCDTFFSLLLLLVGIVGCIGGALYFWLPWISIENREVVQLTMLMLPGVVFVCLFGVCSALLQCEKHFFLTGAAPVVYNGIWIGAVWVFGRREPQGAAVGLSLAICIAFFFQWLIILPKTVAFLRKHLNWQEIFRCKLFSKEMWKMMSSLSLGVLGVTAVQINTAMDCVFSRIASLEGPAYLNYAIHLQQLPLALFGVGVASALLPSLSRAFQSGDLKRSKSLVEYAVSRSMLVILPSTAAIFTLGCASVNLIYGRGNFDGSAAGITTKSLWGYGVGLAPMVFVLLLSPAFYAKKDYWTPTICSLSSIVMNLMLNTLFVGVLKWGPESLAFSTSIAAGFNAWLLYRQLRCKAGIYFSRSLVSSVIKSAVCAFWAAVGAVMAGCTWIRDPTIGLLQGKSVYWEREFSGQFVNFLTLFGIFSLIFLLSALTLKRKEMFDLLGRRNSQIDDLSKGIGS